MFTVKYKNERHELPSFNFVCVLKCVLFLYIVISTFFPWISLFDLIWFFFFLSVSNHSCCITRFYSVQCSFHCSTYLLPLAFLSLAISFIFPSFLLLQISTIFLFFIWNIKFNKDIQLKFILPLFLQVENQMQDRLNWCSWHQDELMKSRAFFQCLHVHNEWLGKICSSMGTQKLLAFFIIKQS